jgi:hypothetical protein
MEIFKNILSILVCLGFILGIMLIFGWQMVLSVVGLAISIPIFFWAVTRIVNLFENIYDKE